MKRCSLGVAGRHYCQTEGLSRVVPTGFIPPSGRRPLEGVHGSGIVDSGGQNCRINMSQTERALPFRGSRCMGSAFCYVSRLHRRRREREYDRLDSRATLVRSLDRNSPLGFPPDTRTIGGSVTGTQFQGLLLTSPLTERAVSLATLPARRRVFPDR